MSAPTTASGFTPAHCSRCGRMVWWVMTRHGKWQMVDPVPSFTEGDIVIIGFGQDARAHVLSKDELSDGQRRYRYFAHAAKCPPQDAKRRGVLIFPPRPLPIPSGAPR